MKKHKRLHRSKLLALLLVWACLMQCLPLVAIAQEAAAASPVPSDAIALPDMVAAMVPSDGQTYLQRAYT